MLLEHIKDTFGVQFKLANIPNGSGYHLKVGKNQEIKKFLDIVRPYINEIPSMRYKSDIDKKLNNTKIRYSKIYPDKIINTVEK